MAHYRKDLPGKVKCRWNREIPTYCADKLFCLEWKGDATNVMDSSQLCVHHEPPMKLDNILDLRNLFDCNAKCFYGSKKTNGHSQIETKQSVHLYESHEAVSSQVCDFKNKLKIQILIILKIQFHWPSERERGREGQRHVRAREIRLWKWNL